MADEDKSDAGYTKEQEELRKGIEAELRLKKIENDSARNSEAISELNTRVSNLDLKVTDISQNINRMMTLLTGGSSSQIPADPEVANDGDTEEESLMRQAEKAQEKTPFNERRVYETLVNPRGFSKRQLNEYADAAINVYEVVADDEVQELIDADFKYWTQQEFALLTNRQRYLLRDFLLERAKAPIMAGKGVPAAKSLAQYIDQVRADEEMQRKEAEERRRKTQADASSSRNVKLPAIKTENYPERNVSDDRRMTYTSDGLDDNRYSRSSYRGRPSDVRKLFDKELRYSGQP